MAVARQRAVTPVITITVVLAGSRLVREGTMISWSLATPRSRPVTPTRTTSG
jgi:hypothetical protein